MPRGGRSEDPDEEYRRGHCRFSRMATPRCPHCGSVANASVQAGLIGLADTATQGDGHDERRERSLAPAPHERDPPSRRGPGQGTRRTVAPTRHGRYRPAGCRHLARHAGQLHLHGGRRLGDATAEALGTRRGFLCLRGVERLSPLQAWLLAGHEGPLFLDDMDIDTAVAEQLGQEALVQHVGPLTIAGLEELDAPTARIPAAQAGLPFGNLFTLAAEASGLASARGGFAHSPRRFAS
jgi:hypothetical protein